MAYAIAQVKHSVALNDHVGILQQVLGIDRAEEALAGAEYDGGDVHAHLVHETRGEELAANVSGRDLDSAVARELPRLDHRCLDAVNEVARERSISILRPEHQHRIEAAYDAFSDQEGFSKVATIGEIAAQAYNLSIPLYVKRKPKPGASSEDAPTLAQTWSTWEESSRLFWSEMDQVIDLLDGLVSDDPDLAEVAVELARLGQTGTFHVVGPDRHTEFTFARLAAHVLGYDVDLIRGAPAVEFAADPRPSRVWLDRFKLRSILGPRAIRGTADGLRALRAELFPALKQTMRAA